jgi:hypothetical protein
MSLIPGSDLVNQTVEFQGGATANSGAPLLIVAAGTGDNTAVTGQTMDTLSQRGDTMLFGCVYHAALGASETLSIAAEYQTSSDGSTWATAVALQAATVVLTDSGSGSNLYGITTWGVDIRALPRYIRINFTPNLSASSTDTASVHSFGLMAGIKDLPAS